MSQTERATAALYGLAIGDALGMPTQLMSRQSIREQYGAIDGFRAATDAHPIAAGLPAGSVTDDTEQALLLADVLIEGGGHVGARLLAERLVSWEQDMRDRGSLDLLGPSTKLAVDAVLSGEAVETAGRYGNTNGAAMRVTPVGIAVPADDLALLVDRVEEASLVSHHTGVAIAGASAVAAAVSTGVDGGTFADCVQAAVVAATLGAERGHWVAGADVARRIEWITTSRPGDRARALTDVVELIGTSLATQESVPAVFGILAAIPDHPWGACCAAASLGGDTDTVAAMVGAISGAIHGSGAFPTGAVRTIEAVNRLGIPMVAERLIALR